jgi:hypothetical protein
VGIFWFRNILSEIFCRSTHLDGTKIKNTNRWFYKFNTHLFVVLVLSGLNLYTHIGKKRIFLSTYIDYYCRPQRVEIMTYLPMYSILCIIIFSLSLSREAVALWTLRGRWSSQMCYKGDSSCIIILYVYFFFVAIRTLLVSYQNVWAFGNRIDFPTLRARQPMPWRKRT